MTGETTRCLACSATVEKVAVPDHDRWHDNVAGVAIESTKRIETLENQVSALIRLVTDGAC